MVRDHNHFRNNLPAQCTLIDRVPTWWQTLVHVPKMLWHQQWSPQWYFHSLPSQNFHQLNFHGSIEYLAFMHRRISGVIGRRVYFFLGASRLIPLSTRSKRKVFSSGLVNP